MQKFFAFLARIKSKIKQNQRIKSIDISFFLRQFATLLTAGIPILNCLDILEKSQIKISMRILLYSIKRELLSGKDVYSSLRTQEKYFDEFTCQLIKIGESTGKLDITLQMIADEHEKQLGFIKRIKQALFYPCIIFITAILVTLTLMLFVIPRFAELFADTSISLPALTRGLFFISDILNQQIYLLFIPLLFLPGFFLPDKYSLPLKKAFRSRISKLPFIYSFLQKILLARFARHLAMTFSAGIPITEALKLLMHSPKYPEFMTSVFHLRSKIQTGIPLYQGMQSLSYFPDIMIQMVKIGEESGALDQMLIKVAGFFEADIDQLTSQFSRLLEPLIMLILGVVIGGLIIGLYLPIFKLGSIL